jgi:lactobin A/cerein 7B family class IIb bacteriocin
MNEKNENQVKELSKEEMENVQGGVPTVSPTLLGVVAEAGAQTGLAVDRPPLNFFYNMGLPGG